MVPQNRPSLGFQFNGHFVAFLALFSGGAYME